MRFVWSALTALVITTTACEQKKEPVSSAFTFAAGGEKAARIPWHEWGPAAFQEARETGKPIFLSARGDLCMWCDILDRTSLSDERVVRFLSENFVSIRVDVDSNPAWADHYLRGQLPIIGVVSDDGDILGTRRYLQPSDLIQNVRNIIENPSGIQVAARQPRYEPSFGLLKRGFTRRHLAYANLRYDFGTRGYQEFAKRLSGDHLTFDLLVGSPFQVKDARMRFAFTVEEAYKHLRDEHAGGFREGSHISNWTNPAPVKRSADQAIMAALLHALPQLPMPEQPLERSALEYQEAGTGAAEYLLAELVDEAGWVAAGEIADLTYYDLPLTDRRRKDAPRPARVRTDEMARTAMWLSRAGRWADRPGWISTAEKVLVQAVSHRTPEGLFWHLPQQAAAPNYLGDATAVLNAAMELYLATGDETWLTEAEQIFENLSLLKVGTGYAAATTEVTRELYTAERVPAHNFELARGLFKLGTLTGSEKMVTEARRLVENWVDSPALDEAIADYALTQWLVGQHPVRLELPRDWRGTEEAGRFTASLDLRTVIHWIGDEEARVCIGDRCAAGIISADEVSGLSRLAYTGKLPQRVAAESSEDEGG